MNVKGICGCILSLIVGFARLAGGIFSLLNTSSATETGVGIGLIIIGLLVIVTTVILYLKRTGFWWQMLMAAIILFWIDGIINGFLLFGAPLLSGQIINICCVVLIFLLTRSIPRRA